MDVTVAYYIYMNAAYQHLLNLQKYKYKRSRRWWMLTIYKKRTKEIMEKQFQEMLTESSKEFHNFCRMSLTDFEILLQKVDPIIAKKDTKWRGCIPSKVRLAVTLRFLASGDSYKSLHILFKISSQIISKIVQEVCAALWKVLKDYIKIPNTEKEWLAVEHGFHNQFPHAIGAVGGKHVMLQAPIHSGSEYYNSIMLLALVDSNYCFMFADIECQGQISDGGILKNSSLWNKMENDLLGLPMPTPFPNGNTAVPYVFLCDGGLPPNKNLMKPYPREHQDGSMESIFNRRLSSAHVVVENTFGVMSSVFRVLRKPLLLESGPSTQVIRACVVLHNFLRMSEHSSTSYSPPGTFDVYDGVTLKSPGLWRDDIPDKPTLRNMCLNSKQLSSHEKEIRDEFAKYFHDESNLIP